MATEKITFLKRLKVLVVEDDDVIRTELGLLFESFFDTVYTACNGEEGFELFKKHKLDMILSDINMPRINGIDMVKKIREIDEEISIIFATAYSDTDFLFEAIKLHIYDYVVKPIDIKKLLFKMNLLAKALHKEYLINQQNNELDRYKDAIDKNNIVIKTDKNRIITYANEQFYKKTGYMVDEVIGKNFSFLNYQEAQLMQINKMFEQVFVKKEWVGNLKNKTKTGEFYIADCFAIATFDENGEITGMMSIQRDITEELEQIKLMKKTLMKDKSEAILKGKEGNAILSSTINKLNKQVGEFEQLVKTINYEKEKLAYDMQKIITENNKLRTELHSDTKNNTNKHESMPENRQIAALRINEIEKEKKLIQKKLLENKKIFEERILKLEEENKQYFFQIESLGNISTVEHRMEYWKTRAEECFRRIEKLEKDVLDIADEKTVKILLNR